MTTSGAQENWVSLNCTHLEFMFPAIRPRCCPLMGEYACTRCWDSVPFANLSDLLG